MSVTGERVPLALRDRALINETAALLAADLSLAQLYEALCTMLAQFIDASVVFIALEEPDGTLKMAMFHDHGETRPDPGIILNPASRSSHVMRSGHALFYARLSDWTDFPRYPANIDRPDTDDSHSAIFVPIQTAEARLGVLSVQSTVPDAYKRADVQLLEGIGRYLAIAVRNKRMFDSLKHLAETDPLTGLANHSSMLSRIDARLGSIPPGEILAIIFVDITNFGLINDTYGAAQGDRILTRVAQRLSRFEDERIEVGRFGGDDFIIVAQVQGRAVLDTIIHKLRSLTSDIGLDGSGATTIPISVNIGYVTAPEEGLGRSALLALAELRVRLSLQSGGIPMGGESSALVRFGDYLGIEPIVECALMRDPYTRVHLIHVNHIANTWAPLLGLAHNETERFVQSALLHDIGKLLIPDSILLKPARLTNDEFTTMKMHAEFGANILKSYARYAHVAQVIYEHHEFYDGKGYPNGIAGERIDRLARMVGVIDAFSAMTVDRPYHRGVSEEDALRELERCSGTQFDPALVESFCAMRRTHVPSITSG